MNAPSYPQIVNNQSTINHGTAAAIKDTVDEDALWIDEPNN